jgi:hypothetical protein
LTQPTTALRSLRQRVEDPTTVADINLVRNWGVQLSDVFSRTLGKGKNPIAAGIIVAAIAANIYDVMHNYSVIDAHCGVINCSKIKCTRQKSCLSGSFTSF